MTALDLPMVDPMMVRAFIPIGGQEWFGGVMALEAYDVTNVGLVTERLPYDEDWVDCSQRMFQATNYMLMAPAATLAWTFFPSRRWRNLREGDIIPKGPDAETPLLYLGNPIRVTKDEHGLHVFGRDEFIIKGGMELGY